MACSTQWFAQVGWSSTIGANQMYSKIMENRHNEPSPPVAKGPVALTVVNTPQSSQKVTTMSVLETTAQRNERNVLIATVAGSGLVFIVGSIINVALPQMQTQFGVGATGAQWIINAYLLPLGALILMGGALGDHYGRKRVFMIGLVVFIASCLLCAVAWTFPVLLVGRAIEGIGAAMIAPNSLAIIGATFTGKRRGAAVGTWAAAGAAAAAFAPPLGGIIVDQAGWRWAFIAVIPIAIYAFYAGRTSITESTAGSGTAAPLDWVGAGLSTTGLFALIWGLIELPDQGPTLIVLVSLTAGVGLLGAFITTQWWLGNRAMTPLVIFANTTFAGLSLLTFFLYAALSGLLVLLPYVMIRELGYGATAAGAALLPFPLVIGALSRLLAGQMTARFGTRKMLVLGSTLVATGFGLFTHVPITNVSYWRDFLPGLLVLATGMAASVAPLTTAVLNSVGDRYTGVASGVNNAIARIAGMVATALLGLILIGSANNLVAGFVYFAWSGVILALASAAVAFAMVGPDGD